jgi:hypothetical protein
VNRCPLHFGIITFDMEMIRPVLFESGKKRYRTGNQENEV